MLSSQAKWQAKGKTGFQWQEPALYLESYESILCRIIMYRFYQNQRQTFIFVLLPQICFTDKLDWVVSRLMNLDICQCLTINIFCKPVVISWDFDMIIVLRIDQLMGSILDANSTICIKMLSLLSFSHHDFTCCGHWSDFWILTFVNVWLLISFAEPVVISILAFDKISFQTASKTKSNTDDIQ